MSMSLRAAVRLVAVMTVALAGALPASAEQSVFSVTPMAGYRGGGELDEEDRGRSLDVDGDLAGSLVFNLEESTNRWYELLYSRQETSVDGADVDLSLQYLHVGGMAAWPQNGFSSYLAAGIGATFVNASGDGSGSDTRPSFSVGLGVLIPVAERIAVRLESRAYLTLTDGDTDIFCRSGEQGGVCRLSYSGDLFTQIDAMAGLTFRF
ncbi:outer membrane protein [Thioalkalivibrio sp.]|uniref:outer membrane protein n=1 Tax=Thioalkalivibrio sp. TaxID=2093813 RepID=UPI003566ECAF